MKTNIGLSVLVIIFSLTFFSCDEENSPNQVYGDIALYLLDSYETVENSAQIIESSVITKDTPLISYDDFISYNPNDFTFEISDAIEDTIKELSYWVHGLPFAVKSDDELVYTGYFWFGFSSAICSWIVIDPILSGKNKLKVQIGYPAGFDFYDIPDNRNDYRITETFKRDNKLEK